MRESMTRRRLESGGGAYQPIRRPLVVNHRLSIYREDINVQLTELYFVFEAKMSSLSSP